LEASDVQYCRNLKLLQAVGPVTAALPEFKQTFDQIVGTFKKPATIRTRLRTAYDELQAENSGGHARLQEMLRKAEQE
jgi:hypothetical protein